MRTLLHQAANRKVGMCELVGVDDSEVKKLRTTMASF